MLFFLQVRARQADRGWGEREGGVDVDADTDTKTGKGVQKPLSGKLRHTEHQKVSVLKRRKWV